MTIVIVIDLVDTPTNGSVMTAIRFANGLKKRGHTVKMVAIGANGENDVNIKERYVPVLTEVSWLNQIKFGKFDEKLIRPAFEGADVIHVIFPFKLEKKCKQLADKMGIPCTCAFHVQPEDVSFNIHMGSCKALNDYIYRFLYKKFYRYFDRIHCPSAFIANQLSAHGYKGELYVISNGYDKDFAPPETQPQNKKFEIVMVGRLSPEKNQKILISAIAKCKYRDSIHLTLLGNGPTKKRLMKQAKKSNLDVTFDFLHKEQLIEKLQNSNLYVHTSRVEIEAIACLEAIACGLVPVIADSKMSATPQFALDSRSLFEDNNVNALVRKIEYWYEHTEERLRMSAIYANYAKKYSLETSLTLAEQMFNDQIHDKRAEKAVIKCETALTATE